MGVELSNYINEYMIEQSIETRPYDLDVINYYKEIRNMYDLTLNAILEKLNLMPTIMHKNIFDELAAIHTVNSK